MTTSPIRFARSLFGSAGLAAIVGLYALAGCSGGGTSDEGASSSSSSSSGGQGTGSGSKQPSGTPPGSSSGSEETTPPGSSTSGPTTTDNAPSCQDQDDCPNWFCECEEGPPVNTRHCTNGRCENAAVACPKSCKAFGTCWIGQAGGGWEGGTNSGPNDC